MSSLTLVEKARLEELLGMGGGYVLDFSDKAFAAFFRDTAEVDINADKYTINGTSKARRFRAFWELESDHSVGTCLAGLLEYWHFKNPTPSVAGNAQAEACEQIVARLLSTSPTGQGIRDQLSLAGVPACSLVRLAFAEPIKDVLESRRSEAIRCLDSDAPLAAIILSGSVLEGLLFGLATANPQRFNQAASCPKDQSGKPKQFRDWSLAQLIDAACELGYLSLDVKKFSHCLRDFRNYVHPYEQVKSGFEPDVHTAKICLQVLDAAIACLGGNRG